MVGVGSGVPPSFPPSRRPQLGVYPAGAQGVKSARNLQDWSRGGGGGGRGGEKKGEADCRETAPGTPSPGTWPLGPQPQKRPCPPRGRAPFPRPASALQLCVPRRVGCRISSQALAACSVFPNPPVGEGGSPVRIRVPPPLPPPAPSHSLLFPAPPPPAPLPNFFPFPILAPAPPSPTSIGSQVPSSGWRGQVGPRFPARRWERQTPQADTETCWAPARLPAWRPPHRKTWPQVHPGRWLRALSRPGRELVPGAPAEPGSRLWAAGARPRGTLRGGGKVFRALARFCPAGLLYNNHHLSGSQAAGVSAEARMPASAPPPGPGRGLHQDGGVGAAQE